MGSLSSIISLSNVTAPPRAALSIAEARGEDPPTAKPVQAVTRIPHPRDDILARQPRQEARDGERSQEGARSRDLVPPKRPAEREPRHQRGGSGLNSSQFLVQVLGQNLGAATGALSGHRDGSALGSEAYRRAGAEPAVYTDQPTVFRVAV